MNDRFWIAGGALLAGAGVAAGAIGTHFLKESLHLPDADLQTYDVAVRYHMVHALALVLVGLLVSRYDSRWLTAAGCCFLAGIVLFSGGLYAWIFSGIKPFVHVVPVGGFSWIVAWLFLAAGALTARSSAPSGTSS